jgi:membrane-associated phospholipid phosphatase
VLDRTLFGVGGSTLNEVFARHHWSVADVVAGLTYLAYVIEYLGLAMLLFFRGETRRAHTFARGFCVVSALGFITYVVYPAAPPWYVAAHGLGPAQLAAVPSAAAATRFDALLGTHVFANAYGHSVEVFGALPSLHVAYPALAMLTVRRTPSLRWARVPTTIYALLMCFSAIYLQHHYVIDVLLGVTYAAITALLVLAWERREHPERPDRGYQIGPTKASKPESRTTRVRTGTGQ